MYFQSKELFFYVKFVCNFKYLNFSFFYGNSSRFCGMLPDGKGRRLG